MKRDDDRLSLSDLAAAAGIPRRGAQLLMEAGFIPEDRPVRQAKRIAVIGALISAGLPLKMAGGLAAILTQNFNRYDGEVTSRLEDLALEAHKEGVPFPDVDQERNDLDWHRMIYHQWPSYPRGMARDDDAIVEIADRKNVFLGLLKQRIPTLDADPEGFFFVAVIEQWEKSGDTNVTAIYDKADPEWIARERKSSVGKIVVNVSLAVRNAFDRLAEHKRQKWVRG